MTQRRRIILAGIGGAVVIAAIVLVFVVAGVQDARNYDPRVESYRRVGDDMHIVVFVALGYGDPILGSDIREDRDKVTVTVHARYRDLGFKQLTGSLGVPVTVTLRDPLRRRAVLDSAGAPVPEITCPGGTLSCFIGR